MTKQDKVEELLLANAISFTKALQQGGGACGYLLEQNASFFLMLARNNIKVTFEVVKE